MYVCERLLITRPLGRVNLLQSQPQLAPVTLDIDIEPQVGTFILDVNNALYVGTHSGYTILDLEVGCFWLKVQDVVCCQYGQGFFFLIKKPLVMFVVEITKPI